MRSIIRLLLLAICAIVLFSCGNSQKLEVELLMAELDAEDDALKIINEGGAESAEGILTDKKYKSFALSLEFQLTNGANSGVLFHVSEDPKYIYAYETGTEFQIIDHANWPDPLEGWQICGANYAMHAPEVDVVQPLGEWNQMMLVDWLLGGLGYWFLGKKL